MLKTLRVTPVEEIQAGEVVRFGDRVVLVDGVATAVLPYKGAGFPVAYVEGRDHEGGVQLTLRAGEIVIAGR